MCLPAASPPTNEMALAQLLLLLLILLLLLLLLLLPDVRVITDKVDTVVLAVDHIDRPVRRPGVSEEFHLGGGRTEI